MTKLLSLNILVVEDNDHLRNATVDFLNARGHQAFGIGSSEEMDDTPMRDVPDIYLVDVNLPGENGFELARRIRKSQPLAGIIMMTARGQLEDRLSGYDHGADIYLIKPVEQVELVACIHNLGLRIKAPKPETSVVTLNTQALRLEGPDGLASLTQTESLLLAAFCRAAGQKLERWQVMQLVDPNNRGLTAANMEMRVSALRKKLVQCGTSEPSIQTLRGFGYGLVCKVQVL
jgi:DNA-binding response OmpR family regulator